MDKQIFTRQQENEINRLVDVKLKQILVFSSLGEKLSFPIMERLKLSKKAGYNSNMIYCFSMLSFLAYKSKKEIYSILDLFDSEWISNSNFQFFNLKYDTQFFIISNCSNIIISYRGTQTDKLKSAVKDWTTNSNIKMIDCKYGQGKVHSGFQKSFFTSWEIIKNYIEKHSANGSKKVYVTGHSLGGALATLCYGALISENKKENKIQLGGLYTFGQPKLGCKLYAKNFINYRNKIIRVQNCTDPVPLLPPSLFGKNKYKHISKEKTISWKEEFRPVRSKKGLFLDGVFGYSRIAIPIIIAAIFKKSSIPKVLIKWIDNHSQTEYIKHIKKSSDRLWNSDKS